MLEYRTRFNKISDSLYILVPSVVWQDSLFLRMFSKVKDLEGSSEVDLFMKLEELPDKKIRLIIEQAPLKSL